MAQKIVVDSSVIVKWLNTDYEQNLDQSNQVLKDVQSSKIEIICPELVKYEIGNVLLFGKKLSSKRANILLHWLFHFPIKFIPNSEELSKETFSIAEGSGMTYYDATFVALAKLEDAVLITDNPKHQGKTSAVKVIALKDY